MEYGGHISTGKDWASSLLKRMGYVQRKATTSKSKYTAENFSRLNADFLMEVVTTITFEEIPAELVLNWDQTGVELAPSSGWTMEKQGAKRVELSGANNKQQITAVFCGSMTREFLPLQVTYVYTKARHHVAILVSDFLLIGISRIHQDIGPRKKQ